ncbi:MAG: hypothetical protein C0467_07175 [Planctomycetaceae bacterium]|nr:hypothetical protein [Planctomycetaceae bacterium]
MLLNQTDAASASVTEELSDRELLQRFEVERDEAAFAAVIRRHGPMVLRVGQRVLDRREDAEDVFQATFLVLAKKAGTVTWRESIGTWLHEAAQRLAREVRRNRARRQAREARRETSPEGDALAEVTSRELLTILDDEMASLPEDLRAPLLLCCLEGMSSDEAANQLGCSPSTVKRRLRQARELLQARLARRGVALSVTALATLLALGTATAKVPAALVTATTRAATQFVSGIPLASGLVSTAGLALTRHLLPIIGIKAKILVGLLVMGGLIGAGATFYGFGKDADAESPAIAAALPEEGRDVREVARVAKPSVLATVETTLRTSGPQIRQYAFDGNPLSCYASANNPSAADHFTLLFDKPVAVKSVGVQTGYPNDSWILTAGQLEVSADGVVFEPLAGFKGGLARGNAGGRKLVAVRVHPEAQTHPLVIREFTIDSDLPVAVFRQPVEFAVDVTAAPEMAAWANRTAQTCERAYPMICDELAAEGFRPPSLIPFVIRRDASGLVGVSGGRIIASSGYFEANPHDVGAVVYATSHVVQAYRGKSRPGWLVNGIADYIRFFKFEPGAIEPPNPLTARYDGDSRETAAFLAYLVATYDSSLVRRLNEALRNGQYTDDIWVSLTKKSLRELGDEWHRSLRR